jgi:hypothetical protein
LTQAIGASSIHIESEPVVIMPIVTALTKTIHLSKEVEDDEVETIVIMPIMTALAKTIHLSKDVQANEVVVFN